MMAIFFVRRPWLGMLGLFLVCGGLSGCGGGPGAIDVAGTVLYQGEPLADATVVLALQDEPGGPLALGTTDSQGQFRLRTTRGPTETYDGALPGSYRVTISKFVPPDGMSEAEYERRAAEEAARLEELPYGSTAPGDALPPKIQLLPPQYSDSQQTELTCEVSAGNRTLRFELE